MTLSSTPWAKGRLGGEGDGGQCLRKPYGFTASDAPEGSGDFSTYDQDDLVDAIRRAGFNAHKGSGDFSTHWV